MSRGLFRYDVTACDTKIIPGRYGFIAQLNKGRHLKKRPTEFRVDKVLQDFDETKFNFTKVGKEEVLFRFEKSIDHNRHFFPSAPPITADSNSSSVVAINVSKLILLFWLSFTVFHFSYFIGIYVLLVSFICEMLMIRWVQLSMDMFSWYPKFSIACLRGLIMAASYLLFIWLKKQQILSLEWVTTVWVLSPQLITYTFK